jgi:U3 small nucleolar RNA-associated protein 21
MPRVKTSTLRNLLVSMCGVQSCAISACGTFAVLGTEAGWIECFNLQSGIRRGTFEDPAVGELRGHNGPVLGLTSDATNSLLTSSGYDGFIKVWSFKGRELKSIVSVGSPVLKMVTHQGNGLSAFLSSYIWGIAPSANAT